MTATVGLTLHRHRRRGVGDMAGRHILGTLYRDRARAIAMALAAEALTGHHDFRSFTSTQDPRRDTHRTIEAVRVRACEHYAFPLLGDFCAAAPGAPQPPASAERVCSRALLASLL